MTKNIFKTLLVALIALSFITSCKKDECINCPSTAAEREALYVGTYTGSVTVTLGSLPITVPATFTVTNPVAGDDSITLTSAQLANNGFTINAKINSSDCKKITTNPVISDSLAFSNLPSTISSLTPLAIKNFNATGSGDLSCNGKSISVNISVNSGTISSPSLLANGKTVAGKTLSVSLKK